MFWAALVIGAPTVLVMPFEGKNELVGEMGVAIQLRAIGTIDAIGGVNLVHPKQVNRVVEHHTAKFANLDEGAVRKEIGTLLGADWIVSGTLQRAAHDVE